MAIMKNKKSVRSNKLCLKAVVLEVQSKIKSCSNKDNLFKISMNRQSSLSDNSNGKRTLSKIIKAVLFQTSMSMKVGDRKNRQNSFRSMSNLPSNTDDSNNTKSMNLQVKDSIVESNPKPCIIRESNTTYSPTPESNKNLTRHNRGLYLVLMSLTITIFWGKLCAVLLTSTWLYFDLRQRKTPQERSENDVMSPEMMRSKEYKKRVIMEGLLERNHHHPQSS